MEKKRLGDILIDCNLITKEQLSQALTLQRDKGVKLGQALIDQGLVTEDDIIWALGNQLNISFIHLNPAIVDTTVLKQISPEYAHEHRIIPLYKTGNQLHVCMVDPLEVEVIEYIAAKTQSDISVSICTKFDFEQTFSTVYGPLELQSKVTEEITSDKQSLEKSIPKGMEGPEKVINYILGQAITSKTDRVHFEPSEKGVLIRFRTCSSLIRKLEISQKVHLEIISRLKALSQIPGQQGQAQNVQVGHFRVTVSTRPVNVQALFYPTVNGEMVILKLSYFSENAVEILGKSKPYLDGIAAFLHQHHGVLFITGPRESGRTVSSYFLLNTYDFEKTKIVTVEDPVQTNFAKITQIQLGQNGIGTLSDGFNLALQLDPDVIYLDSPGETELLEEISYAGLGGKTVLVSFMAHDAASSIIKILEKVPDPLLISTSLCGILSQRLIRTLCPECRKPNDALPEQISRFRLPEKKYVFFQAGGCEKCHSSGYTGRILVPEFIPTSPNLRQMMINRQKYQEIFHFARKLNIPSIEDGIIKLVVEGETSFDEFQRLF